MTILLVVTGFSLVLVYNNLLTSTLLHNGCGNSCVSNVSTNLEGIVTYCDHLVKSNSVTSFCIDLLNFDQVLAVNNGEMIIGTPTVAGATVSATVMGEGRAKKVIVYKYKRKTGYHKKNGHRQSYTELKIEKINA